MDLANVHARMRIRTMELPNPDNPISVPPDCHTDQADPVWRNSSAREWYEGLEEVR